ncbi:MAG: PP2C family serine/threonine-protein phosphatase [Pseudomonadota bacterium]
MASVVPARRKFVFEVEAATRRGLRHKTNEDAYLVDVEGGLFSVSDGMGGHRDGNVASNAIVTVLSRTLNPEASFEERIETATLALKRVNEALFGPSRDNPEQDISGATTVSLIVGNGYGCCLWAGDSRLYLMRDENLYLISEDHAGAGGMLTRAVGSAPALETDRRVIALQPDDLFLLCSDGLLKGMNEDELLAMLTGAAGGLAERLVAKAVAGGSTDDITLILVGVGLSDE